MKRKKQSRKKSNLSFRRKLLIYTQRAQLLLKLSILILFCLLVFTDVFKSFTDKFYQSVYDESSKYGFALNTIILQGDKNTPLEDIGNAIGVKKGCSVFEVDVKKVKERLESHIWIKSATVERRLPDKIHIAIVERVPVAIWQFRNKLYLVDSEGNRIVEYKNQDFGDLLHVIGQDANVYAKTLVEDLNRYPSLASRVKSATRYGKRRWDLEIEQNITVKMPEMKFQDAYKYLKSLYKAKKLFNQDYEILDLRDKNKYYLKKY